MAKTNQPLMIHTAARWAERPEVKALEATGHRVILIPDDEPTTADLILHPAAHSWDEWAWEKPEYLAAAMKAARKRKKAAKA